MNISLKKKNSIIVGGSGQFGVYLANELIKKKLHVIITTRNINNSKKKVNIKVYIPVYIHYILKHLISFEESYENTKI